MFEVCPAYTDKRALADIGINDWLVKLRSLIDQTCFWVHRCQLFWRGKLTYAEHSRCCILL